MKKVMNLVMMAIAAIVLTLGFAACSSDDDNLQLIFQKGFDNWAVSAAGTPQEVAAVEETMKQIEDLYNQAIGNNEEAFTMTGSESDCSAKIKTACQKAEKQIPSIDFGVGKGSFTYKVTCINSNKVVYSYTYTIPSK